MNNWETTWSSRVSMIWQSPRCREYLLVGLGLSLLEFIVLKILYPYADFISDSYSYITAAKEHLDISLWPIGYSKFLAGIHMLSSSDTLLVGTQFFLMQGALLWLFFTLVYFFPTSKLSRNSLFWLFMANPLSLYLCNTVNSDALFGALSLFWLAELCVIIRRPTVAALVSQALLLFLCFTIRNNAYYYPFVTVVAFLLSPQAVGRKLAGLGLSLLLVGSFVFYTREKAFEATGTRQFSLFSGWQLANNALYIYDYVAIDSNRFTTAESRELNRMSRDFFIRLDTGPQKPDLTAETGNYFIRRGNAPLKKYFQLHYSDTARLRAVRNWGDANAHFEPFGKQIILDHPMGYFQHFVLPNVKLYFLPPLSHLELYNYGLPLVNRIGQSWFNYPSIKIDGFTADFQGKALLPYVYFFLLINLCYAISLSLFFINRKKANSMATVKPLILLFLTFLAFNFFFSIGTTMNILRYQFVPLFGMTAISLIMIDSLTLKSIPKEKAGHLAGAHPSRIPQTAYNTRTP